MFIVVDKTDYDSILLDVYGPFHSRELAEEWIEKHPRLCYGTEAFELKDPSKTEPT